MKKRKTVDLDRLIEVQRKFVKDRDWTKFHTPKNMAMALGIEATELMELFLWVQDEESRKIMKDARLAKNIKDEMADVFYWLLRLVDVLEIDLEKSFLEKMKQNEKKYPIAKAKGRALKYTEY